jgi:thioredoxin reductase (NADPH)
MDLLGAGIYAIGGITNRACLHFAAAEHSARLLCQRLFRASRAVCDYDFVPSAIFTPLEYGYVGLTEEEACKRLGRDRVSVYHRTFMPTHYHLLPPGGRSEKDRECYAKVVCDGFQDDRLIGLHIAGYKASEIIQGKPSTAYSAD